MRIGMRRLLRRILLILLFLVAILTIRYFDLIVYGISQAKGQLTIVWNARPVEEYLADPHYPDTLKQKLRLIEEVRAFAIDSLGLRDTRNYKTLYDQKGKEVMWVVTASERFRLQPYYWKFPILGSVPYKGFFNEESARKQAEALEAQGWDVNVRNPGGWSTLGWFTDPILSKMLERDVGDLASLIIHEMVHATIFVKDSVDFNENLASFIGDRGAEVFLKQKFGPDSKEYLKFVHDDSDYIAFVDHVLRGTQYLDSLYSAIESEPVSTKQRLKEAMIRRIVTTMDTLTLYSGRKPTRRFKDQLPNNAFFMSFIHYQSGQDELVRAWKEQFGGDLKAYIAYLKEHYSVL
jgi:predicted aminopeptidase